MLDNLKYHTTLDNIKVLESQRKDKLNNIEQIENNIKQIEGTKKEKILELRNILEDSKEFTKPQIKDKIIKDLDGIISQSYIRSVLGEGYGDPNLNPMKEKERLRQKGIEEEEKQKVIAGTGETKQEQSKEIPTYDMKDVQMMTKKDIEDTVNNFIPPVKNEKQDPNKVNEIREEIQFKNEIDRLKQENRELRAENEKLKARIIELEQKPKPVQQAIPNKTIVTPPNLFSNKRHDDWHKNKYNIKK